MTVILIFLGTALVGAIGGALAGYSIGRDMGFTQGVACGRNIQARFASQMRAKRALENRQAYENAQGASRSAARRAR